MGVNCRPVSEEASCAERGSKALAGWVEGELKSRGLSVKVDRSVCVGHCPIGPNVRLPGEDFIHEATREKLIPLLDELEARALSRK